MYVHKYDVCRGKLGRFVRVAGNVISSMRVCKKKCETFGGVANKSCYRFFFQFGAPNRTYVPIYL